MAIRVFVVDDSDVFLDAVHEVLAACPDFEPVGRARTGEAAIFDVQRLAPDLVLVDVQLPGIDGLETARRLNALTPRPSIILCSVGEDPHAATPFIAKSRISPSSLREAWRASQQVANLLISG